MANFLCDNPCVTCPGSFDDNPFANLTAEGPDIDRFIGHQYPTGNPPLGSTWYTIGCDGWCFSNVSQDDADLCALRQAVDCQSVNWPVLVPNPNTNPDVVHNFPDIPQARELFYNQEQSATAACPNGDPTSFVCPAGTFNAFSQSEADAQALSYAQNQSVANYICFGPLTRTQICSGLYYNGTVAVTSSTTPLTYSVTGNLPDGVFLVSTQNGFGLQGLPTTPGTFTFTVTAVNPGGTSKSQEYTISVTGITNDAALTPAVVHQPYLLQLDLEGVILNSIFEFVVTAGALPAGLTLNATSGIISGTPTVAAIGTSSFTVTANFYFNGDPIASCGKEFTIVTTDPAGPFWDIVWAPYTLGAASVVLDHNFVMVTTTGPGIGYGGGTGTFLYTGPAINCRVTCVLSLWRAGITSAVISIPAATPPFGVGSAGFHQGENVFNFTLPAGTNVPITIRGASPANPYFYAEFLAATFTMLFEVV